MKYIATPSGSTTQRALVLGASGHIGNAVVRELLARGCTVTAARRGRTSAHNLAGLAVCEALGDGACAATVDGWVTGHDLVVDAAAPYPLTLGEHGAVAASSQRAAILVDAVARHRARLVHIGAFAARPGSQASERVDDEIHPYFAAKRAGEAVFAAAARTGAPITIVHPTICMGPWDSRSGVVPWVLAGRMPAMPSHIVNVIDVRDVARAVVGAAAAGSHGEPLLLSGHNVGLPELCDLIGELAGTRVTTRPVPPIVARAGAWAVELGTLGVAPPPLLLVTLLALRHTPVSVGATQRALGASPRPLSDTLRDAIAWYREHPSPGSEIAGDGEPTVSDRRRPRRPEPLRSDPVRHVSGAFRAGQRAPAEFPAGLAGAGPRGRDGLDGSDRSAAADGFAGGHAATSPFPGSGDDLVSRAVRAGCDVVEQAVRRGSGVGRDPFSAAPWGPWSSGPFAGGSPGSWPPGRWLDALTGAFTQWTQYVDAWSAMARGGGGGVASGAWPAPAPAATVGGLSVTVELRTPRAAAVQLELSPGAGSALEVYRLVAPVAAAPPITDITIAVADGGVTITLGSLEHHPAGTYTGAVLSAGRACGALTIRLR